MIHVTTEIGKPGRHEREKRHFPENHNQPGPLVPNKPRGRRYIPHNSGKEDEWRPHNLNINVEYTEVGPDWSSRLKYIPHPENPQYPAAEIWPDNWKKMRAYPFTYSRSKEEWLLDPGHKRVGLRCVFDGVHKATLISDNEMSDSILFGKGRQENVIDKRNSLSEASPGDKSYQVPEYSPSFYKATEDSHIPKFSIGNSPYSPILKRKADTFVPLIPLPQIKKETYRQKTEIKQHHEAVEEVKQLETWQPAKPLLKPVINPADIPKKY